MVWLRALLWRITKNWYLRPREVCKRCFRENPLGFTVPDEVWAAAVPEGYRDRVLCIFCSDELAARRGVLVFGAAGWHLEKAQAYAARLDAECKRHRVAA